MFKGFYVAALGVATVGLVLTPSLAQASTPWPQDPFTVGDFMWEIRSSLDTYGSTDAGDTVGSMLNMTGILELDDNTDPTDGTLSAQDMCADPIEAPGAVTTDGADTIITCAPYTVGVGDPGEGLNIGIEFRSLASESAARLLYTLTNGTGSDITVPRIYMKSGWENSTYCGVTSSGVTGACDGSDNMGIGTADKWMVTTDDEYDIPSASVWASCQVPVETTKNPWHDYYASTGDTVTIPAGQSLYYVAFLLMQKPATLRDLTSTQAAIDELATRITQDFDYLSPNLRVGIPENATIDLWDNACGPQPTPEPTPEPTPLPNTGVSVGMSWFAGVAGVAFMLIGAGFVMIVRRLHN